MCSNALCNSYIHNNNCNYLPHSNNSVNIGTLPVLANTYVLE